MSLPWFGWIAVAAGAFLLLAVSAMRAWRKQLVNDVVSYLGRHLPDWTVEVRSSSMLMLRNASGDSADFSLVNLRAAASQLRGDTTAQAAARESLIATSVAAFREQFELLSSGNDDAQLDRILPRIVNDTFVAGPTGSIELPRRAIGDTSLFVVYVIDSANAVAYVDRSRLTTLGLTEDALHARAIENLRRLWPVEATRLAVENGAVVVNKALDTYDAARLLLLPERLREREEVAALIPDRDTLVLAPIPADGDWAKLHRLAEARSGPPLFGRALRVSPAGIRVA